MRSDAQKNYEHLLAIAHDVVKQQGADASLRDVARKAGVGLGTLYRHFPTREALLEALLRTGFDKLATKARVLELSAATDAGLIAWLDDFVVYAQQFRGVTTAMMAAIEDEDSALHASCVAMKAAGTRILHRAQAAGTARKDLDGADLFALGGALAWLGDQPAHAPSAKRLRQIFSTAILTKKTRR